ncbi:histidine phosphatase family protein [Rufibacter latericius]|uniref:Phosphoglycerate mutase n=1 Tax=Rufibacter latericius TaxID=2487040 RepID=A0A3M9N0M8_9BACT|nr:histidine phosphatase family protein [Rufibacter latericius]RNI31341.1 phosphoglycerate mutase [Rufibacter latericius]
MTKLLLIRHATTDSVGKRLSGRTPGVSLNEEGKEQARQLTQQLSKIPLDALYTSPLERTLQTADYLAQSHGIEPIIDEAFLELNFGEWTNRTFEELAGDPDFQRFNTFRSCTRVPGGEMMLEAQARFMAGLQKLCAKHPHETVAVVSHSDLIKAAVAYYAGIPLDMFQRLEISPASVTIIEVYEETARILLINSTGELKP